MLHRAINMGFSQFVETSAYMNPITAITFSIEKMNSASPYARTPKKLMLTTNTQKIATQAAGEIDECQ